MPRNSYPASSPVASMYTTSRESIVAQPVMSASSPYTDSSVHGRPYSSTLPLDTAMNPRLSSASIAIRSIDSLSSYDAPSNA